jgi:hypothetical protein
MFVEVLEFFYCKCCACSKSGQQNDNLLPIRYFNVKYWNGKKVRKKWVLKNQKLDILKKVKESKNDVKPKSQVRIKVSHRR